MKSGNARKTSITIPRKLESELRTLAEVEDRTLSGLLQEAARMYLNIRKWESLQESFIPIAKKMKLRTEDDVDELIHRLRR